MKRFLIASGLALALLAGSWVWVYGASVDARCLDLYRNLPEGSAFRAEGGLWPPGTKCVYELPNGRKERRSAFP